MQKLMNLGVLEPSGLLWTIENVFVEEKERGICVVFNSRRLKDLTRQQAITSAKHEKTELA